MQPCPPAGDGGLWKNHPFSLWLSFPVALQGGRFCPPHFGDFKIGTCAAARFGGVRAPRPTPARAAAAVPVGRHVFPLFRRAWGPGCARRGKTGQPRPTPYRWAGFMVQSTKNRTEVFGDGQRRKNLFCQNGRKRGLPRVYLKNPQHCLILLKSSVYCVAQPWNTPSIPAVSRLVFAAF